MSWTFTAVICSAVVAVSVAAIASPASAASPSRTQIVLYTPFTVNNTLTAGAKIVRTASGSCWEGSLADERSDAWRCFMGNSILDPCYSGPPRWVACVDGNNFIRLNLTKPLPFKLANKQLNIHTAYPYEIVLAHGVTCGAETGATGAVGGYGLAYGCSNGGWLLDALDRSSPLWRILYLPSLKASHATSVAILVARW